MKDYYSLLGIEQKATKAEIKKNYRLLATKYHPDKSSDPGSAAKFIAITEAYDTLSNRKSRAQYDLVRWQALKKKQATNRKSFTVVTPPRESTRTRRNKAQKKRSLKYQQASSSAKKTGLLLSESLFILSRYILHILAITLIAVILSSVWSEIFVGFDAGIINGLLLCALALVLLWSIYKLAENMLTELKKDLVLFSIFYKITHRKALLFALPVFAIILCIYLAALVSR